MRLLRNSEVNRTLLLQIIISIAGIVTAYNMDRAFAALVAIICVLFIIIYFYTTSVRYKKMSELSGDINKILHGDNKIVLEEFSEGELGILQSEIYKMTIRLREQQQHLQDDKIYLADSIADISHQIRTPLTSINLIVQFLSEPEITYERRLKLTHELYELLSRIDWLITSLLKISKLDAGTVKFREDDVLVEDLLRKALAPLLVPMELREQDLVINVEGQFKGDIQWTSEAIVNIVKNCMEHTPNGGKIEITATENPLFTEILIVDNGVGIAKEDLPHIFERFYKGKNSDNKSFGIGLALARMIITTQNGTIKAENNPDCGAKFTVRFYKGVI